MKKVKIMLSAIVVMAVVGGSLAFKAKVGGAQKCIYSSIASATGSCPLQIKGPFVKFTTTTDPELFYGTLATPPVGNCPALATCTLNSTYNPE